MRPGLYAIVDVPLGADLTPAQVAEAVLADGRGATTVQLRAKDASTAERVAWAQAMAPACRAAGVPLIVNDDLAAALAAGADGVHLGQGDPHVDDVAAVRDAAAGAERADFVVGLSTHDLGQLRQADRQGPDYLAFGPVRATGSKRDHDPVVGMSGLLDACRIASRPVVAIGGLDARSGAQAMRVGATAVAVIGALRGSDPDAIRTAAVALHDALTEAARPLELDEVARRIPVLDRDVLAELARWGDSLATQLQLKLPARFRPYLEDGRPRYRPCDVVDLEHALGKRPSETWAQWRAREPDEAGPLVPLRRR